ncbi:hypothetical protein AcW2_007199 [Taiwanofungus camphoratus]|nr:hypothetical protein AcW2_007199 [Antrodia cinnamomea]
MSFPSPNICLLLQLDILPRVISEAPLRSRDISSIRPRSYRPRSAARIPGGGHIPAASRRAEAQLVRSSACATSPFLRMRLPAAGGISQHDLCPILSSPGCPQSIQSYTRHAAAEAAMEPHGALAASSLSPDHISVPLPCDAIAEPHARNARATVNAWSLIDGPQEDVRQYAPVRMTQTHAANRSRDVLPMMSRSRMAPLGGALVKTTCIAPILQQNRILYSSCLLSEQGF